MKKRCPTSSFIDGATLKKYKRIFDGTSERWQSCTANLLQDDHSETIGAVYKINQVDFLKLDSLEELRKSIREEGWKPRDHASIEEAMTALERGEEVYFNGEYVHRLTAKSR